ncbi:hypothetical protein DVH24_009822, partial [Malus domestica]
HKFLFFLLPRLFTTCLSSFCGSNSKQKRKKITSRSNRISSIGCLDKLFCSTSLKTSVDSWLQRRQVMLIYRHPRKALEFVTWGRGRGHDLLPLSVNHHFRLHVSTKNYKQDVQNLK